MKVGMTLIDIAQKLKRQANSKRHVVAPEQAILMDVVQFGDLGP